MSNIDCSERATLKGGEDFTTQKARQSELGSIITPNEIYTSFVIYISMINMRKTKKLKTDITVCQACLTIELTTKANRMPKTYFNQLSWVELEN